MTERLKPETPDPVDFLAIDDLLTGEERMLRDTVRKFVADKVTPNIAEWF
ncbi:MAG: acyl-CoA dehydrogenase family protein, partial [Acidimicrobiia bacterium]